MTDNPVDLMTEYAHYLIRVSKATLRAGDDVLAAAIGLFPDGAMRVVALPDVRRDEDRVLMLRQMASEGAEAVMLFGDAHIEDAASGAVGEALVATISLPSGHTRVVSCTYTRAPLRFEEEFVDDTGMASWGVPIWAGEPGKAVH